MIIFLNIFSTIGLILYILLCIAVYLLEKQSLGYYSAKVPAWAFIWGVGGFSWLLSRAWIAFA